MRFSAPCRASTPSVGAARGASRGPPQPPAPGARKDACRPRGSPARESPPAPSRSAVVTGWGAPPRRAPPGQEKGGGAGPGQAEDPAGHWGPLVDAPGRGALSRAPLHPVSAPGPPPTAAGAGAASARLSRTCRSRGHGLAGVVGGSGVALFPPLGRTHRVPASDYRAIARLCPETGPEAPSSRLDLPRATTPGPRGGPGRRRRTLRRTAGRACEGTRALGSGCWRAARGRRPSICAARPTRACGRVSARLAIAASLLVIYQKFAK